MSTVKTLYPATSSVAVAISLASLPSDSANMLVGQASSYVDNSVTQDLDHLVTGFIKLGSSPVVGQIIEVWAYAPVIVLSGGSTFPDSITGIDARKTATSANVKYSSLILVASMSTDAATGRLLYFAPVSISRLFGSLPVAWGLFVVNGSGVALDATASSHVIHYHRQQLQSV